MPGPRDRDPTCRRPHARALRDAPPRLGRLAALAVLFGALSVAPGCIYIYGANVQMPGAMLPPVKADSWEVGTGLHVGRSASTGLAATEEGLKRTDTSADGSIGGLWPGFDVYLRHAFTDEVAFEARGVASMLVPFPFPIPNGLSLSPIIHLWGAIDATQLHVAPRFVLSDGEIFATLGGDQHREQFRAVGLDLPLIFTLYRGDMLGVSTTLFGRTLRVTGHEDRKKARDKTTGEEFDWQLGPSYSAWVLSTGATVHFSLTLGVVRLGLALSGEMGPHPGADLSLCKDCKGGDDLVLVPGGNLSLGFAW